MQSSVAHPAHIGVEGSGGEYCARIAVLVYGMVLDNIAYLQRMCGMAASTQREARQCCHSCVSRQAARGVDNSQG